MNNVEKAKELVQNYKRALAYLDSGSQLTYEHLKEASCHGFVHPNSKPKHRPRRNYRRGSGGSSGDKKEN